MKRFCSFALLVATFAVSGCCTPKPLLDMADKTSGNVSLLNSRINAFAADQQQLINQRISIDANLADQYADLAARNQIRTESMRLAGMNDQLVLIQGIINSCEVAVTNQAVLLQVKANQTKLMSAAQLQLQTYQNQTKTISDALSQLATDESLQERLMDLATYAQAVKASVDAAEKTNSTAAADANFKAFAAKKAKNAPELLSH